MKRKTGEADGTHIGTFIHEELPLPKILRPVGRFQLLRNILASIHEVVEEVTLGSPTVLACAFYRRNL